MAAFGIMAAISDHGYRIPADFSVCGFDNITLSAMPQIALTTIDHASVRKGERGGGYDSPKEYAEERWDFPRLYYAAGVWTTVDCAQIYGEKILVAVGKSVFIQRYIFIKGFNFLNLNIIPILCIYRNIDSLALFMSEECLS